MDLVIVYDPAPGPAGGFSVTEVSAANGSNGGGGGSITLSSMALGDAVAGREIYAAVSFFESTVTTYSSVTIAGVTASLVGSEYITIGPDLRMAVYKATVPTGTTGDVVIAADDNYAFVRVKLFRVIGRTTEANAGNNTGSTTLTVPNNSYAFIAYGYQTGSPTATGFSFDASEYATGASGRVLGCSLAGPLSSETNRTFSVTGATDQTIAVVAVS